MIVLDIETYKDVSDENYTKWKSATSIRKDLKDPDKIAKAQSEATDKFALSPLTGKIILGMVLTDADGISNSAESIQIMDKNFSILKYDNPNESDLIANLLIDLETALDNGHMLVTYNGKNFDLPYIMKRSVILGIAKPHYIPYSDLISKYKNDKHVDLFQLLNDYGQFSSLSEWSYKLHNSLELSSDGNKVGEWYETGQMAKIIDHCKDDLIKTYLLYEKLKGWL